MKIDRTKTFKQNIERLSKKELVKLVEALVEDIYKNDILEPGMYTIIGIGEEYESVDDWKNAQASYFLTQN